MFAGGQAAGSLLWGVVAQWCGLVPTFLAAAALMAAGAVTRGCVAAARRRRSWTGTRPCYWPEPELSCEPRSDDGPVLVTVRYAVVAECEAAFVEAMEQVRRTRLRTGASSCGLYRDGADPAVRQVYVVPTWDEHLRQHAGRLTGADRAVEEAATALSTGPPQAKYRSFPDPGRRNPR